jgi:glutamine synthetase
MSGPPGAAERSIPSDVDGFARWCRDAGIRTLAVGGSDTHGVWRGKRLPLREFLAILDRGVAISDVIFVLGHREESDEGEELAEPPGGAGYAGYFPRKEHGFPDAYVHPELATARVLPWHDRTVGVLGGFSDASGEPLPIDVRAVLARQLARAAELGYRARFGFEYEFYVFRGDARSLRDAGYRLDPLHVRPYIYSIYGGSLEEELLADVRAALEGAGVPIEASAPETGAGQYELNLRHAEGMRAADDALFFKHGVKELLAQRGLLASFMAKPRATWSGSSCHLHQSLWSLETGDNVLADVADPLRLSDVGRRFVGGMLSTMRALTAIFWPTPNSYKRNVPYSWAGTTVSWGRDNRTTALRTITTSPAATRVEHRVPGADANPYLVAAASLAGGIHGIEAKVAPPDPVAGDAYADAELERLPRTLDEALDALEASILARDLLGEQFVEYYVALKRSEAEQFRRHVSAWEIERYLEMS